MIIKLNKKIVVYQTLIVVVMSTKSTLRMLGLCAKPKKANQSLEMGLGVGSTGSFHFFFPEYFDSTVHLTFTFDK